MVNDKKEPQQPGHTITSVVKVNARSSLDAPAPGEALKVALQVARDRLPQEPQQQEGHAAYVETNRKTIGGKDGDLLKAGSHTDKRGI